MPACLNFIYFTTITKQVIQVILIMLIGTDVCVLVVFVWEETGVLGGNPPVWLGDHMTMPACCLIWKDVKDKVINISY